LTLIQISQYFQILFLFLIKIKVFIDLHIIFLQKIFQLFIHFFNLLINKKETLDLCLFFRYKIKICYWLQIIFMVYNYLKLRQKKIKYN